VGIILIWESGRLIGNGLGFWRWRCRGM